MITDLAILRPPASLRPAGTLPAGPVGPEGPDAYVVAVRNGFTGSVADWMASLAGGFARLAEVLGSTALLGMGPDHAISGTLIDILNAQIGKAGRLSLRFAATLAALPLPAGDAVLFNGDGTLRNWTVNGDGTMTQLNPAPSDDGPRLKAILLWAAQRRIPLSGEGRWYATSRNIRLPENCDLADCNLVDTNPTNAGNRAYDGLDNRRILYTGGENAIRLARIRICRAFAREAAFTNIPGLTYATAQDAATYRCSDSAAVYVVGGAGHVLEDIEVFGGSVGTGLSVNSTNDSRLTRCVAHDISYNFPDATDDVVQGLNTTGNLNIVVDNCRAYNLTGNGKDRAGPLAFADPARARAIWTRGLSGANNTAITYLHPTVYNVDQAMDVGNVGMTIVGGHLYDCRTWGLKQAHRGLRSTVYGLKAERCGFSGFVIGGDLHDAVDNTINQHPPASQFLIGCHSIDSGSTNCTGTTTPTGSSPLLYPTVYSTPSGFDVNVTLGLVGGVATASAAAGGIHFLGCIASDTQGRMAYGWRRTATAGYAVQAPDVVESLSPCTLDASCYAIGHTVARSIGLDSSPAGLDANQVGLLPLFSSATVASAATVDLGAAGSAKVEITGAAAITAFGARAHGFWLLRFIDGGAVLTHNAATLILPGAASIVTAAGDTCLVTADGSGNARVRHYQRASGKALVGPDAADLRDAGATGRALVQAATAAAARTTLGAGTAGGLATLDGSGTVPTAQLPASILGDLKYQGGWNAATNSPAIPAASAANMGWFYVVRTAGTTAVTGALDNDWQVGDWLVSNGATGWDKIDNNDLVRSVAGLVGTIPAAGLKTALALAASDVSGVQPLDGTLTALAALVTAADQVVYATGADTFAMTALTAFARTLLAGGSASAVAALLNLGATANASFNSLALASSLSVANVGASGSVDVTRQVTNGNNIRVFSGTNAGTGPGTEVTIYLVPNASGLSARDVQVAAVQGASTGVSDFVVRTSNGASPAEVFRLSGSGDLSMAGAGNVVIGADRCHRQRTCTVATLPTAGIAGRGAYPTNARTFNGAGVQEAAGTGTGAFVVDTGSTWRIAGTNVTASA